MSSSRGIYSLFYYIVELLSSERFSITSDLEGIVINAGKSQFAYIDDRKKTMEKYGFDLWKDIKDSLSEEKFMQTIKNNKIDTKRLYSSSWLFPDFLLKTRKICDGSLCGGDLLELKDSKGGSISSFNSTIPTKFKNLEQVEKINHSDLVTKIACLIDKVAPGELDQYKLFERRCFYLVRTHGNNEKKAKISIVDGSFFETIPKAELLSRAFKAVFERQLKSKGISIDNKIDHELNILLKEMDDQALIAFSQEIEKASVKPRFRVMAEVHPEGNPHNPKFYPQIEERTINLIVNSSLCPEEGLFNDNRIKLKKFSIFHKRNGEHLVYQFKLS